jgi:hypothetical protein
MKQTMSISQGWRWLAAIAVTGFVSACGGGGQAPILGVDSLGPVVVVGPAVVGPTILSTAAPFGMFGGTAGMTNQGIFTVINGDIGTTGTTTSSITGFHFGANTYTETTLNIGNVTGKIFSCTNSTNGYSSAPDCEVAKQGAADALVAYNALKDLPPKPYSTGELGGAVLAPGTYTAPAGFFQITGSDLTLSGDANAVWVFQMGSSLTVGAPTAPRTILLTGGALAKNVFWQVGSAATINPGGGGIMVGTIIAKDGVTFSTAGSTNVVTLNGRALSLGASVTMVNTVINVPL